MKTRALFRSGVAAAAGLALWLGAAGPAWTQERMIMSGEVRCAIKSWWHPSGHHFYAPVADGDPPGWTPESVRFVTFARRTSSQMVPLYRMFRPGGGHFYTSNLEERNRVIAQAGFTDERHIGYVYPQPYSDLVALHRWYKPGLDRHFYSVDRGEGDRARFTYEGVVGYVRPPNTAGPAELACASSALDTSGVVAAPPPAPPPQAAKRPFLDFQALVGWFGGALNLNNTSALANASPLANATPLANAAPLANASSLNNTSALSGGAAVALTTEMPGQAQFINAQGFTMPMGNNFTMPMGNNLNASRGVQSIRRNTVGVVHVMGGGRPFMCLARNPNDNSAYLTPVQAQSNACAARPDLSVFIFTADGKIRWMDPARGPSDQCLSMRLNAEIDPNSQYKGPIGYAFWTNCQSARNWQHNPADPDALSIVGWDGYVLCGVKPNAAAGDSSIDYTNGQWLLPCRLQTKGRNWGWGLVPMTVTLR